MATRKIVVGRCNRNTIAIGTGGRSAVKEPCSFDCGRRPAERRCIGGDKAPCAVRSGEPQDLSDSPARLLRGPSGTWWWINPATTPNDCSVLRANDICPLRVRGRIQPSHAEHQCTDEPKISVTASNAKPSPKSSPSPPTSSPNSPAKPSPPSPPPSARQGNTPQWCGRGSQPEVEKRPGTSCD